MSVKSKVAAIAAGVLAQQHQYQNASCDCCDLRFDAHKSKLPSETAQQFLCQFHFTDNKRRNTNGPRKFVRIYCTFTAELWPIRAGFKESGLGFLPLVRTASKREFAQELCEFRPQCLRRSLDRALCTTGRTHAGQQCR